MGNLVVLVQERVVGFYVIIVVGIVVQVFQKEFVDIGFIVFELLWVVELFWCQVFEVVVYLLKEVIEVIGSYIVFVVDVFFVWLYIEFDGSYISIVLFVVVLFLQQQL